MVHVRVLKFHTHIPFEIIVDSSFFQVSCAPLKTNFDIMDVRKISRIVFELFFAFGILNLLIGF